MTAQQEAQPGGYGHLRKDALTVVGAVALSMAFMGPATSVFFNTQPAVGGAGYALPLGIVMAMIVCLMIASTIGAFAQKIPTAGFAYTFNTHGFGKRGGFMTGWLLVLAYGMLGPMLFPAIGELGSEFLSTNFAVTLPWWIITIAFVALIWGIAVLGIERSAETALLFLAVEVCVMVALFLTIIVKGGAQGNSLQPFSPASSPTGLSGLGVGMLWGVLMFIGFESAGTLGEETRSAKRNIPIALFTAVIVIGAFYVLAGYAAAIGFGKDQVATFQGDGSPWVTLGTKFWGGPATWIVAAVALSSIFANLVSGSNAVVRVIFAMGREAIFPRKLGETRGEGSPFIALSVYMVFSLAAALIGGAVMGPLGAYAFYGTILGLGLVVIYILMHLALIIFYRRDYPSEFSIIRHGAIPVVGALLLLLPIYGQVWPYPAMPNGMCVPIIVAWIVVGVAYLYFVEHRAPERLEAMGRVMGEA
jgi:amino acid transporter